MGVFYIKMIVIMISDAFLLCVGRPHLPINLLDFIISINRDDDICSRLLI